MSLDYIYDTFAAVLKKLKASYCKYTALYGNSNVIGTASR